MRRTWRSAIQWWNASETFSDRNWGTQCTSRRRYSAIRRIEHAMELQFHLLTRQLLEIRQLKMDRWRHHQSRDRESRRPSWPPNQHPFLILQFPANLAPSRSYVAIGCRWWTSKKERLSNWNPRLLRRKPYTTMREPCCMPVTKQHWLKIARWWGSTTTRCERRRLRTSGMALSSDPVWLGGSVEECTSHNVLRNVYSSADWLKFPLKLTLCYTQNISQSIFQLSIYTTSRGFIYFIKIVNRWSKEFQNIFIWTWDLNEKFERS